MRKGRLIYVALTLSIMVRNEAAQAAETLPLFDDFKTFCIDTNADPDRVRVAAEAAGASARPEVNWREPGPSTTKAWTHAFDGHVLLIYSQVEHDPPIRSRPATDTFSCAVSSDLEEVGSIAAIRAWVGVSPSARTDLLTLYDYYTVGTKRIASKSDDRIADRKATDEGRSYLLSVSHGDRGAEFQLSRFKSKPKRARSKMPD